MADNFYLKSALLLLLLCLIPVPGSAETNYGCLTSCVKGGSPVSACMAQCPVSVDTRPKGAGMTDYRCLSLCVDQGKAAEACLPQCSYNDPQSHQKASSLPGTAHNLLHAPVPIGDAVVPIPQKGQTILSGRDYPCLNQCLHEGMQYEMCVQRCPGASPSKTGG